MRKARTEKPSLRKITRETRNFTEKDIVKLHYFLEQKKKETPLSEDFTKTQWKKFIDMTKKGISTRKTAPEFNVSQTTIVIWRNALVDEFKKVRTKIKLAAVSPVKVCCGAKKTCDTKTCKCAKRK